MATDLRDQPGSARGIAGRILEWAHPGVSTAGTHTVACASIGRAHLGRVMSGLAGSSGCQPRTMRMALTCLCKLARGEAESASVA